MSGFKAPPEEIAGAAVQCDSTAGSLQDQLATLKSYVISLESVWQGVAADAFQDLMLEYDTYASLLHNALADIASGLRGNFVNYTDTENANKANINHLESDLTGANLS